MDSLTRTKPPDQGKSTIGIGRLAAELGKELEGRGYVLADGNGLRRPSEWNRESVIGVLRESPAWGNGAVAGLLRRRGYFVGVFNLKSETEWRMEVYGDRNKDEMKGLAMEFSQKYFVNIKMRVFSHARKEPVAAPAGELRRGTK